MIFSLQAPGIIIIIIYFLAVALTGESFITERATGLLERSRVAGVQPSEILASHIITQCGVMIIQTAITLSFILLVFNIPCAGPVAWLAVITLLQGLAGMSFGFLVSSLCDSEALAMQVSIGSFYPCLLLSGILWPLEGMASWLQTLAMLLPNTLACQAMRDIMLRGWDISQADVYLGVNIAKYCTSDVMTGFTTAGHFLHYLDNDIPRPQLDCCKKQIVSKKLYKPLLYF